MSNLLQRNERKWQAMMARVDTHAAEDWRHPADAIDGGGEAPGGGRSASELFVHLLATMLPGRAHCGGMRRIKAGYHRMCAFTYRVSPEVFDGMNGKQIAASLGIQYSAWKKHLDHVDAILRESRRNGQK